MATMKHVAELAGVSITTVSHVLNETRKVHPGTRQRVLDAIEQTGYTGDAIARSLVTGGTRSLGVAFSLVANPHLAELLTAIESEATRNRYSLLLMDTHDEPDTERTAVRALRSRRVDGLLLTPSASAGDSLIPELVKLGIPTVLVDRLPEQSKLDQIGPENVQSMSTLVEHLAGKGHSRIGMITGGAGLTTTQERVLGYRLGLGRNKLSWDPALVVDGESGSASAEDALSSLLDGEDPPTAVIAGNNTTASGVLRAAAARSLRVGRDLAVVAYDDVAWADLLDPPLTTMAQPLAEIGRSAVRLLLDRIENPDRDPKTVRLPTELRHRRSCGCN